MLDRWSDLNVWRVRRKALRVAEDGKQNPSVTHRQKPYVCFDCFGSKLYDFGGV